MVKKLTLFLLACLFLTSFAFSATTPFFEFNPDYYNVTPLEVFYSDTPSEVFIAQNDYLNGFDLWLDNDGLSGQINIDFLVENTIITTKTVTVPSIPKTVSGQRFHVDIPQIAVNNSKKYAIRVNSALPNLRLFYGNRIKYLTHNASYASQYANGVALLGSEEMSFSFKFALYESREFKNPIIINVSASAISENQAKIVFNADEPVDYRVLYGLHGQDYTQQTNFFNDYKFCGEGIALCELLINVEPEKNYDFELDVRDIWGNISQFVGSFATYGAPSISPSATPTGSQEPSTTPSPSEIEDTTPPIITGIKIAKVGPNSVEIYWRTNEPANSALYVTYSDLNIAIALANDSTKELEHYLVIGSGLNPRTTYNAEIVSYDLANNPASASFTFTTDIPERDWTPTPTPLGSPDPSQPTATPTPQPQNIDLPEAEFDDDDDNLIIKWSPPAAEEPLGGYRIDIFDGNGQRISSHSVPAGEHQISVPGNLTDENSVIVYANNDGVYKKVTQPTKVIREKSFLENLVILLPYILGGFVIIIFSIVLALKYLKKNKPKTPLTSAGTPVTDVYSSSQSSRS